MLTSYRFSDLYNASVSVLDPYKSEIVDIFEFPGISHDAISETNGMHASGLILRPEADTLQILLDNGEAFPSQGNNVSGPDFLYTMNLATREVAWKANLTAASDGTYGGYADAEIAADGNSYIVGCYPSNILRVTPSGEVSTFYLKTPITPPRLYGFTGLTHSEHTLITPDNTIGQLIRLDTRDENPSPVVIKQTPYHNFTTANVMSMPEKYNDNVLLLAENMANYEGEFYGHGGISVWTSDDKWQTANYKGFVPSRITGVPAFASAARQMADRIYMLSVYVDGVTIYVPGTSSEFLFQDITSEIDALLV